MSKSQAELHNSEESVERLIDELNRIFESVEGWKRITNFYQNVLHPRHPSGDATFYVFVEVVGWSRIDEECESWISIRFMHLNGFWQMVEGEVNCLDLLIGTEPCRFTFRISDQPDLEKLVLTFVGGNSEIKSIIDKRYNRS